MLIHASQISCNKDVKGLPALGTSRGQVVDRHGPGSNTAASRTPSAWRRRGAVTRFRFAKPVSKDVRPETTSNIRRQRQTESYKCHTCILIITLSQKHTIGMDRSLRDWPVADRLRGHPRVAKSPRNPIGVVSADMEPTCCERSHMRRKTWQFPAQFDEVRVCKSNK